MVYDFHKDKTAYHLIQYKNARHSILPFVSKNTGLEPPARILEIGSGEGGNLKPFAEAGYDCTGVELSPSRVALANEFCKKEVETGKIRFITKDIYDLEIPSTDEEKFGLIFLKDVLEHIPDQGKLMHRLKLFLKPDGLIFLGFPSWYMPFGGHQQMCFNKVLARTPWFHLLPMAVYKKILQWFNKHQAQNGGLMEIRETGISIHRFERILKKENYEIRKRRFYLIPPIYSYKFGLKVRRLTPLIGTLPLFRELFITSAYYLISRKNTYSVS